MILDEGLRMLTALTLANRLADKTEALAEASGRLSTISVGEVMTAAEVAELLELRLSTVEDYARRGILPGLKLGKHVRFLRADIAEHLRSLSAGRRNPYRR